MAPTGERKIPPTRPHAVNSPASANTMPARMNKNKSSSKTTKPKCDRCGGGHASAKCKSFKAPRNVPIDDAAFKQVRAGHRAGQSGPAHRARRGRRTTRRRRQRQLGLVMARRKQVTPPLPLRVLLLGPVQNFRGTASLLCQCRQATRALWARWSR